MQRLSAVNPLTRIELSSSIAGSAEGSRYLRERRYAPVRENVRDLLTTLNSEQLKLS
jgi:hypothetical protein